MDARREHTRRRADASRPGTRELGSSVERHLQLGDIHRAADSVGEALRNYEAALAAQAAAGISADVRAIDVHLRIADCRLLRGELREARNALQAAAGVHAPHDPRHRAQLSGYNGILAHMVGDYDAAIAGLDRGLAGLADLGERDDVAFKARLLLHRGGADERLGHTAEAGTAFEDALRLYQSVSDRRGIAHALNNLGLNRKQQNRLREAIAFLHRALEVLDEVGDYGRKAPTCLNLGLIYTRLGEWSQARGHLSRALQIAREVDNRGRVARALIAMGALQMRAREYRDAHRNLDEARRMALEHGLRREHVLAAEYLGELALLESRPSHALDLFGRALAEAREVAPDGDLVMEILRRQADAYLALSDLARAEAMATQAAEMADRLGDVTEGGAARRVIGICQIRSGREEAGRATLERALRAFAELGVRFEEARTHVAAAAARLATAGDSRRDAAIEQSLEAARPIFEELGVPGYQAEVLHLACEDRLRTGVFEEAESLLHVAGRYVDAADEHTLSERQMRLRARIEEGVDASVAASSIIGPGRELHRLFREGVEIGSTLNALVEMVQRRTNSDRVALARGPDASSLKVVAACGGSESDFAALLARLEPIVRSTMERGLPMIRREPGGGDERIEDGSFALAPLCLPHDIWGVLYIDRKAQNVAGSYRAGDLKLIGLLGELASISVLALERNRVLAETSAAAGEEFVTRIVYRSRSMGEILDVVRKVAKSPASVLLRGETGTGKGLIARAVHELGPRSARPFVQINCAALPESLLESELFGHVSGAFTGAVRAKRGLFEEAEGGTIFLDEVDKTAKTVQAKLLHVLDHQEIRPVGANQWKRVDARVVSATNADLRGLIRRGEFLEDLYYRLNDIAIHIPPLRERTDDIEPLARHFAERFRRETGRRTATFTPRLSAWLVGHRWAGNVRELEKVVRGLVTMCDEDQPMDVELLPSDLRGASPNGSGAPAGGTLKDAVRELERRLIERSLETHGGNKSAVARELKISYPTLLAKIKTYALER